MPKEKEKPRCVECGLVKTASPHAGYGEGKHGFDDGQKKAGFGSRDKLATRLAPRSSRPNRVQRQQEGADEAREHHARVQHCEAPAYGITTPCGEPGTPEAIREHSHSIGKGMGGGKDYAASEGACAILCRRHHRGIDEDRAKAREVGLSIRAPVPDKVVPRGSWDARPLFDQDEEEA